MDPGWIYSSSHLHLNSLFHHVDRNVHHKKKRAHQRTYSSALPVWCLLIGLSCSLRPAGLLPDCFAISQTSTLYKLCSSTLLLCYPLTCSKLPRQDGRGGWIKVRDLNGQTWDQSPPQDSGRSKWVQLGLKTPTQTWTQWQEFWIGGAGLGPKGQWEDWGELIVESGGSALVGLESSCRGRQGEDLGCSTTPLHLLH